MAVLAAGACAPLVTAGVSTPALVATGMATAASIGGNVLTDLLTDGVDHLRDHDPNMTLEEVEDRLEARFEEVLEGTDERAANLHGELLVIFHEIGVRQTALEAAVGTGDHGILGRLRDGLDRIEVHFAVLQGSLRDLHTKTDQLQQTLHDVLTRLHGASWPSGPPVDGATSPGRGEGRSRPGRPVEEMVDPFELEVHRPVQVDDPRGDLSVLPTYVPRDHDIALAEAVRTVTGGESRFVVLVGGSSTGKTRACWEAIQGLPPGWRLWHPYDPTRPEAVLAALDQVVPRTVVWLNETQFYVDASGDLGERVAARLRTLLTDRTRAPVLVLGTLWPTYWTTLTAHPIGGPDPHAMARELLTGRDITIPDAFSGQALSAVLETADLRLTQAAEHTTDGRITQYLAGVPVLLDRYDKAPPVARALIHAAMDARRLGAGPALPHGFLAAAAPGYLSADEWSQVGSDWTARLEAGLAYAGTRCNGIAGPLMPLYPQPPFAVDRTAGGLRYRLAGYLEQHAPGRPVEQLPPAAFWAAAAAHATADDQVALGGAAESRGLLRFAARLYAGAVTRSDAAAANLVALMARIDPGAPPPADLIGHLSLEDPIAVVQLMETLRREGAAEQAAVIAGRAASRLSLEDPSAVARLLEKMWAVGASEPISVLADRAASRTPLDRPSAIGSLLNTLLDVGTREQVAALIARNPAGNVPLDDPDATARLLYALRAAAAEDQVSVLAGRSAAHISFDDQPAVARLLEELLEVGAREQVAVLVDRVPLGDASVVAGLLEELWDVGAREEVARLIARNPATGAPVDDPSAVGSLLYALRTVGARQQLARLIARDPAGNAPLDDPDAVANLLKGLRAVNAKAQVSKLAHRAAAHAPIDNPSAVAGLLKALRAVNAAEQVALFIARDPAAHAPLDKPYAVANLLKGLRAVNAKAQVSKLAHRAAAHAPIDNPSAVAGLLKALRTVNAAEQVAVLAGRAAAHAPLDDPNAVTRLLYGLRAAGAGEQMSVLAGRAAAHAPLDDPDAVGSLFYALRAVGAEEQIATLIGRDPAAHAPLGKLFAVARLLEELSEAGAEEQVSVLAGRAAAHAPLDNPSALARLLYALGTVDEEKRSATLIARLPAAGQYSFFRSYADGTGRYRFGRRRDGRPEARWGWDELVGAQTWE